MVFARLALIKFSTAAMGLALAGVASGQVADVGTGAAANINADVGQDGANARGTNLDTNAGVDTNANIEQRLGGNANQDAFGVTFDSSVNNGLVVQEALPNSAASRIGLRAGDRIIGFNGRTYSDVDGFNADLARFNSNSNTPIIYERDGRLYTRNIRLSGQNNVRSGSGYDNSYDNSGQSHSVGRPNYGVSESMSGNVSDTMNGGYSGQNTGDGSCCGGSTGYQPAAVYSDPCRNSRGHNRGHHRGRRTRHGRGC